MFIYLKDLRQALRFLFKKGPEINPGAFTFIMKYLALAVISMLASILSFAFEWNLLIIIVLQLAAISINIIIARKLLYKLRHPEQNQRPH